jgi:hypothetical protein
MDCDGVCEGNFLAIESSAFQIGLAVLAIIATVIWVARTARSAISNRRAIQRAYEAVHLQQKIETLCQEIAALPSPPLTPEGIPKRFPSREAAQTFGERWSRGGLGSFRARDIDAEGRDENHPKFEREEGGGGILYPTPALFFGMDDPYRDDEGWYVEFLRAKKSWLENYRTQLKEGVSPY